jgi:hypothetical protein
MKFEIEKRIVKSKDPDADRRFHESVSHYECSKHATHIMAMKPNIASCPYCDGTEEYIPQRYSDIDVVMDKALLRSSIVIAKGKLKDE